MRGLIVVAALGLGLGLGLAGPPAHAGSTDPEAVPVPEGESTNAPAKAPLVDGVEFVVGNDLWQPGTRYRTGADWLALSCARTGCGFEPARLLVKPEQWQGHYDDEPTAGQRLVFTKLKASPARTTVIGWFHRDGKHLWLKPGPVTTYPSSASRRMRPPSEGTLETAVPLPDGTQAAFVPLLDQAQSQFRLQLRIKGRRQMLGQLGDCSRMVSVGYLLWAGDLDRDGRPDYLVSLVDADGQTLLYLASAATEHEIVGVAGIYDAPPHGGECDGDGWLAR